MAPRLVVSEFPNDNPDLHDGLVWACPTPCAPALPTLRLRPSAPARVLRPSWELASEPAASRAALVEEAAAPMEPRAVDEMAPVVDEAPLAPPAIEAPVVETSAAETSVAETPVAETPVAETPVAEADSAVAPDASDIPEARESAFGAFLAALSGVLLERGATRSASSVGALLGESRLARDAFDAATKKALVSRGMLDAKTGRPTPEFSVTARAWRDVLDGASADLGACGNATLDVWGAEILAALTGARPGPSDELRRALRQRGVAAFGMLAAA